MKVDIKDVNLGDLGKVSGSVEYHYGFPQTRMTPEEPAEIEGCSLKDEHGDDIDEDVIFEDEDLYSALLEAVVVHLNEEDERYEEICNANE